MTLRENIILGLTATAAIGAGLYYAYGLFNPTAASPEPGRNNFSALIAKVQVGLTQGELTDREEQVLAAAATQWLRNPLRERPLLTEDTESTPLPKYVGFINTGSRPIAIIDGRDYRSGEAIQGGEFQLSQIHSDHVKLLRRGATDPVNVPLEKPQLATGSQ